MVFDWDKSLDIEEDRSAIMDVRIREEFASITNILSFHLRGSWGIVQAMHELSPKEATCGGDSAHAVCEIINGC